MGTFMHSCGYIVDILDDLIEIGLDILNPIQWRCSGMEREGLKRDFGEAWDFNHEEVFFGGKGNSVHLQPSGDPDWGPNWDEDQGGGQHHRGRDENRHVIRIEIIKHGAQGKQGDHDQQRGHHG